MGFDKLRDETVAMLEDEAERAAEIFNLFIAGPFINVEKPANHEVNSETPAKILRYALYQHYTKSGLNVYLGEDIELRKIGERHYGSYGNAVVYERHHITKRINGTVLLPSSPGSFCETGDWISTPGICQRMMVIIDKNFEGKRDYINEGVVKFGRFNGADIVYIDYADHKSIIDKINVFIDKMNATKRIDVLYDRA